MAKIKPQRIPTPAWSMFPSLHEDVSPLLEAKGHPFTFHDADNDNDCIRSYDTSIMGRFHCGSPQCHAKVWSSKKIAITIRMYAGQRYNARVYHQRCQACRALSIPVLDDSYAGRVAYRLLKWRGVEQDRPEFAGESKGPHQMELCEGCKAGHCREGGQVDGLLDQLSNLSLVGGRAGPPRVRGGEQRSSPDGTV
ncbi:hypothetical protein B2J93_8621 [Marssonina coronariae]|uniref:3CxxC-type domain-containing protein n=1 Tax=Diplocarpon coronariae TaxID=2795749 RepID=A0A218YXG9_9HELO|nr:hypothetical protein JHW43_003384 [Diplocarpon mali]OWP00050.1 hypothetical protein B2J93_8621 [Marssonina coronariae]